MITSAILPLRQKWQCKDFESIMIISIIVAMSQNRVIGDKKSLPWHLPSDMEHFKKLTWGKPVIMGSKTFESIGKPLQGRENIVLAKEPDYQANGCQIAHSLEEAIALAEKSELGRKSGEVMVCGGVSVYKQFLPLAQKMYLTLIHRDFEGDAYFPEFDKNEWQEKERIDCENDEKNPYNYSFVLLEKVKTKNI